MGFLDNMINTGKNAVSTAGKKTDEAVRISKLKVKQGQINADIKAKYEKMGELIYQMAKSGDKDNDAFDKSVAEIDECYTKLDEIDKELDKLLNRVACTHCGAKCKIEEGNLYCPKCGTKLPEPEFDAETNIKDVE